MTMSDPLGDMLTRIRNGIIRSKSKISCPHSKLKEGVCEVLQSEGYIRSYNVNENDKGFKEITVEIKYINGETVIKEIGRVSKPGRRVYAPIKTLPRYYNGLGTLILTTPKGVVSDADARANNVGGEVLCRVY